MTRDENTPSATQFLVAVSTGPVQGFVAAARRTRDFWMGSLILSEVAKAAARYIVSGLDEASYRDELFEERATRNRLDRLIFPAPQELEDLFAWDFRVDGKPPSEFRCTNVILAKLPVDDPATLAEQLRHAVSRRWGRYVESVEKLAGDDLDRRWWEFEAGKEHDVFDTFVAWTALDDDYRAAHRRVMKLLAGRKAIRDFEQWGLPQPGQGNAKTPQKSSLDARRESVLVDRDKISGQQMHLRPSEELDLVGVVKRAEFSKDAIRYPSVSRYAADPWIRGLVSCDAKGLEQIEAKCHQLAAPELRVLTVRRDQTDKQSDNDLKKFPWLESFRFEGTPLYANRHVDLIREAYHLSGPPIRSRHGRSDLLAWKHDHPKATEHKKQAESHLAAIAALLKQMRGKYGIPSPYLALVKGDGDRVGKAISGFSDLKWHRAFSFSQTTFARRAERVINGSEEDEGASFRGATIYAGGDDIMCFVPIDQCVRLAAWLRHFFQKTVRDVMLAELGVDQQQLLEKFDGRLPTFSVGIAIGHFMTPMEDLLHYVEQAEHRAKNPTSDELLSGQHERNALAIADHPRGGASICVRGNWDDSIESIDRRLDNWTHLHLQKQLPVKASHELRSCRREFDAEWKDADAHAEAMRSVAKRIFARKQTSAAAADTAGRLGRLRRYLDALQWPQDLERLACELLISQRIAAAIGQTAPELYRRRPGSNGGGDSE